MSRDQKKTKSTKEKEHSSYQKEKDALPTDLKPNNFSKKKK